jgi:pantoate kinase
MSRLLASGKKPAFGDIIRLSKEFAIHSGLLSHKKTIETIKNIEDNHGQASMIMLGNAVFSNRPFAGARKFYICGKGARIL